LWRSEIHINLRINADALTDASVTFVSGDQYVTSIKNSDGNVLASYRGEWATAALPPGKETPVPMV
jgi:hypothetical protein